MKKIQLLSLINAVIFVTSCNAIAASNTQNTESDIQRVQGLIYSYDRSVTLGGLLNHRKDCISPTWETLIDDQERPLVIYKCQLTDGSLQAPINHDLNNWYQSSIESMAALIPRLENAEPPATESNVSQQSLSQVLQVITTLSQHDWSLLRGHVEQPYLMSYKIEFKPDYNPSEQAMTQLQNWNEIAESLRYETTYVSKYLLPWLNRTANVEMQVREKLSNNQQQNGEALSQFKKQQNEGVYITKQYITALNQAQENAQDWALTQVFIWSLVNPEKPVLTHALYSFENVQGRFDFTPMMEKVLGRSARTDALEWAYQGKLETPQAIKNVAKALFLYQTQSFQKPDISHYRY